MFKEWCSRGVIVSKNIFYIFLMLFFQNILLQSSIFFDEFDNKKFQIFTVPKTGTHLLKKCVQALTRVSCKHTHIDYNFSWQHRDILVNNNVKMLTIIRDPRDWVVSYLLEFVQVNLDRAITMALSDFAQLRYNHFKPFHWPDNLKYKMVSDYYQNLLIDWLDNYSNIYVARFEKLVGPQGGGNKEEQIEEVINIARFLDLVISFDQAKEIANKLFGGTLTFRKGTLGRWKSHFSDQHKELFKADMGDILIRLGYEKDNNW